MHNFTLNSELVLREAYRLASMMLAEPALMKLANGDHEEPLYRLRAQFSEDELVHQLLSLAISNRTQVEHMAEFRASHMAEFRAPLGDQGFKPSHFPCGLLQPDCEKNTHEPLTFHEACHKIIHARNIVAQADGAGAPEDFPMKMEVTLRGNKWHGNDWVAHLDLLEYIRGSVQNFSDFR